MSPILGVIASSRLTAAPVTPAFYSSASANGNGAISFDFNSIPSTYNHLQLRITARNTNVGGDWRGVNLRFNGDSSSNYTWFGIDGNGGGSTGGQGGNTYTQGPCGVAMIAASFNSSASTIINIYNYKATNQSKTYHLLSGYDRNGTSGGFAAGQVEFYSAVWNNTAAINSITIYTSTDTFNTDSYFGLYGIV